MSKEREALKLALEAFEADASNENFLVLKHCVREALAEQPAQQQEPVAVVSGYYGGQCVVLPTNPARVFNNGTAFYTSPPASKPWVGMDRKEFLKIIDQQMPYYPNGPLPMFYRDQMLDIARDIEAKLREKNA